MLADRKVHDVPQSRYHAVSLINCLDLGAVLADGGVFVDASITSEDKYILETLTDAVIAKERSPRRFIWIRTRKRR